MGSIDAGVSIFALGPEDRHLRGTYFFFTCAFHGPPSGIQVSLNDFYSRQKPIAHASRVPMTVLRVAQTCPLFNTVGLPSRQRFVFQRALPLGLSGKKIWIQSETHTSYICDHCVCCAQQHPTKHPDAWPSRRCWQWSFQHTGGHECQAPWRFVQTAPVGQIVWARWTSIMSPFRYVSHVIPTAVKRKPYWSCHLSMLRNHWPTSFRFCTRPFADSVVVRFRSDRLPHQCARKIGLHKRGMARCGKAV